MTAYTGTLCPSIFVEDTLRCSATIAAADSPSPVAVMYELESIVPLGAGTLNSGLPVPAYEFDRDGTKVNSFLDDYYYRMHVTPADFAFGAIMAEQVETFIVWNAFFVPVTNSSISETFPDEFELAGETPPYTYKALEYSTYTITVPKEGSASFEASIAFDFGSAGERTVTLSGVRLIVFSFAPMWPVREGLEWFTDIITPRDGIGSEQRRSVRSVPRQSFTLSVPLKTTKEQSRFDAALFGWQKRMFGLPVWTEKVLHTADIAATATTITVDTTNADFRDDSYAVIWKSLTEYEAVKIETVAAGSLTLETPVVGTFTGNKFIMPLRITQVTQTVRRQNPVAGFMQADLNFAVKDNVLLTGFVADVTYDGLPVLQVGSKQVGGSPKESSIDSDSFSQDYDSGDFDFFSDSEFNMIAQSWGIVNENRAACWQFRLLLHSLFGRQGTIYVPTYKEDLTQAEVIGAADTSFQIENIKLAENMTFNTLRNHLAFIFPDGTHIYKEITGIVEHDEDIEIISIDSALGVEVAVGGCMISFLDKCRLASDSLEIEWLIDNKNYSTLPLIAVVE